MLGQTLAMGQVLYPERSPPAPLKIKPILSLTDSEFEKNDSIFEFSSTESSDVELLTNEQAQHMWENESLANFDVACASVSNDIEFDRLNNKLLVALKQFSTSNKMYCIKCKVMTLMTKRGKTKNTYQFACGSHTLSATQILGTLPDAFVLKHLPNEPRHVMNETLAWLGKDQLSPELQARSAKRNAVKRYSAHRSPIKATMSSLLSSRNSVNEVLVEVRDLKERVRTNESAMNLLKESNRRLAEVNSSLAEQLQILKEENAVLKRHLIEPMSTTASKITYAKVADMAKPPNKPMKFYTMATQNSAKSPFEVISADPVATKPISQMNTFPFSPLKVIYFKGCHRKSVGTYKAMLPTIGFEPQWARHIVFLAEDIIQITTFESKAELLIKAMQSISNDVKHIPDFDPFSGTSYAEYGTFSDESAGKSYLALMKKCTVKLQNDSLKTPSLRRIASFLSKIVEGKNIHFQPTPKATRVFCLGDFIAKKEPAITAMDVETLEQIETNAIGLNVAPPTPEKVPTETETDTDTTMKDSSSTANDQ